MLEYMEVWWEDLPLCFVCFGSICLSYPPHPPTKKKIIKESGILSLILYGIVGLPVEVYEC